MTSEAARKEMKLGGLFSGQGVAQLFPLMRKLAIKEGADIQIVISFPESPLSKKEGLASPSQGNIGVLVSLSAPPEQDFLLRCVVAELNSHSDA